MAEQQQTGLRTLAPLVLTSELPEKGEPSIIRQILNKIPEHNEQAMADEYYGEYPEKTTDTALGILSAFPVTGIARMGNFIRSQMIRKSNLKRGAEILDRITDIPGQPKRYDRPYYQGPKPSPYEPSEIAKIYPNMFKDPAMLPFFQSLGLFMGKMDVEDQKRARRKIEAEEMGLDSLYDHPELQKKANGGEIDPAQREERFVGDLVSGFTDMFETPFEQEISKRNNNLSIEDRMEADMARQELFKGQEMSATDRSALDNFMGGGLEALLLDRYPEVADNPVYKTARFLAPQTLGEAAFEAATLFPPLFWMKPLKAGSRSYKEAKRLQDRIDKLQNKVTRENINATRGDSLAADYAATRAQNDIVKLRDDILEIVRKKDPAYAERLENEARKRYAKAKRDADPIEKVRRRMLDNIPQNQEKQGIETLRDTLKNKNTLVDQKSTLKKGPESELMPEGFRTGEEILEDYNKNMDSIIDQVVKPKTPPETINTDEMSILEILERMKDMDLD